MIQSWSGIKKPDLAMCVQVCLHMCVLIVDGFHIVYTVEASPWY